MRVTSLVPRSLRARFLLIIGAGVVLPLGIVGLWLVRAAERSGEMLLRQRLDASLSQVVAEVGTQWVRRRATLLALAEDSGVQRMLQSPGSARLSLADNVRAGQWTLVTKNAGDSIARLTSSDDGERARAGVSITVPVWSAARARTLGALEAVMPPTALVPIGAGGTGGIGAVLGIVDRKTGVALAPLPFDPALLDQSAFMWASERWVVERRTLDEPPIALAAAAPLASYTTPFDQAARRGAIALAAVVAATLVLSTILTTRLTSSLGQLAIAADAVSRGALDRRVDNDSDDEVGRVARAFNGMIDSLRRTLAELSRREALAAVGGFAASLAHEVRNPLTAIRIDLQRVEEQLPTDAPLRMPLTRALGAVVRLDQTVSGALRVARSSDVRAERVVLADALERAMHASGPAFERAKATLDPVVGDAGVILHGDSAALEQLFLNLLLNAAEALRPADRAGLVVSALGERVEVTVWDTGPGIPEDVLPRVFEPFFSTKPDGTGLGLAIARQIAVGHGGDIAVESAPRTGTTFRVTLPLLSSDS